MHHQSTGYHSTLDAPALSRPSAAPGWQFSLFGVLQALPLPTCISQNEAWGMKLPGVPGHRVGGCFLLTPFLSLLINQNFRIHVSGSP